MRLIPNSYGALLREYNSCHVPPGRAEGGQFARKGEGNCGMGRTVMRQSRDEPRTHTIDVASMSPGARAAMYGRIRRATPQEFKDALQRNTRVDTLSDYSVTDLAAMKLFMLDKGQAGYAIKDGDELVNLFNSGGDSTRGAGPWLVLHAVENGARRGDHFDGYLTGFYQRLGFRETKREKNWTEGGPDVVYMQWAGGEPATARQRYRERGRLDAG